MSTEYQLDEDLDLEDAMEELSSAEDFLEFFQVPYDAKVVHINRLHIMQRFHDYLTQAESQLTDYKDDDQAVASVYRILLTQSYTDFVHSDAQTEKVLKIYKNQGPQTTFVSVDTLFEG